MPKKTNYISYFGGKGNMSSWVYSFITPEIMT